MVRRIRRIAVFFITELSTTNLSTIASAVSFYDERVSAWSRCSWNGNNLFMLNHDAFLFGDEAGGATVQATTLESDRRDFGHPGDGVSYGWSFYNPFCGGLLACILLNGAESPILGQIMKSDTPAGTIDFINGSSHSISWRYRKRNDRFNVRQNFPPRVITRLTVNPIMACSSLNEIGIFVSIDSDPG